MGLSVGTTILKWICGATADAVSSPSTAGESLDSPAHLLPEHRSKAIDTEWKLIHGDSCLVQRP